MPTVECIPRASRTAALALVVLLGLAAPARADLTAFLGATVTPENRLVTGFSGGFGLLIVGFEAEYASTSEDETARLPGLRTWSGNVLLQTPTEFSGVQLYGTGGLGLYRERLGDEGETSTALNIGGGAKIRLAGPLRMRLDYRIFRLQGTPRHDTYHRLYLGANLAF